MPLAKLTNFIRIHACKCILVFLKRKSKVKKLYGKPCCGSKKRIKSAGCQKFAATGAMRNYKNIDSFRQVWTILNQFEQIQTSLKQYRQF